MPSAPLVFNVRPLKLTLMTTIYRELRPSTWLEALALLNQLDHYSIFRGQADSIWELRTSIERCAFLRNGWRMEKQLLNDFKRGASSFLAVPPASLDTLSWLALMQHHGAPTRLLDFTNSPHIASYFALESAMRGYQGQVSHLAKPAALV